MQIKGKGPADEAGPLLRLRKMYVKENIYCSNPYANQSFEGNPLFYQKAL